MLWLVVVVTALTSGEAAYHEPWCTDGRSAFTHLFEWRWDDIAKECENFLGPYGYCGVQISPPTENVLINNPYRPWYERYQPVSYKLVTRSGDEEALRDMISRCHNAGVRIYADVVMNHMTGSGGSGEGTGGSHWDGGRHLYPAVPYGPNDFNNGNNCHSADGGVHNYQNAEEVRNCNLLGLADLALGHDYVRGKVIGYMNHLVDLGVAGFRLDAAKHMWPGDLKPILDSVKNLRSDWFGGNKRPFVFQEVSDMGNHESIRGDEYLATGRITNFRFGVDLARVFQHQNAMKWLHNFGEGWGMWSGNDVVNFIDNHDNQRDPNAVGQVLTHKEPRAYKLATAFMLAHPYGLPRLMSSFGFSSFSQGPPNQGGDIAHVVTHPDITCSGGWVCEHRWRQMYNMVAFRNMAGFEPLQNWWSGADYQIAFSRGSKAFIALNLESNDLNADIQTGLPQGTYCDVISGNLENDQCTGSSVTVGGDGRAHISVCSSCDDPMVAIHVGAKVGSNPRRHG